MTVTEISIERLSTGQARYIARMPPSEAMGILTVRDVGENILVAEHTYVPPHWQGRGVAFALFERLVADARARGQLIAPVCKTAWGEAVLTPDWADVVRGWVMDEPG